MNTEARPKYDQIRGGGVGYYEQKRGLVEVHGKEAVQFLDGLISNDMKTLEDGAQMRAAFPNAQGRLLAAVRVLRQGDRFLFETEEATHEKLYNNLFRFTFAGDFFVDDISANYRFFTVFGIDFTAAPEGSLLFDTHGGTDVFAPSEKAAGMLAELNDAGAVEVDDELYETLRIENGVPLYNIDMDETTIVPELGIEDQISYTKGCYIGQEIIARIHFRGHVAKRLTGLQAESLAPAGGLLPGAELSSPDGKNAGRITSVTYSPKLEKDIALAYVRYDYLAEGTELIVGETSATVKELPFV